jgi:hypothetical protein
MKKKHFKETDHVWMFLVGDNKIIFSNTNVCIVLVSRIKLHLNGTSFTDTQVQLLKNINNLLILSKKIISYNEMIFEDEIIKIIMA